MFFPLKSNAPVQVGLIEIPAVAYDLNLSVVPTALMPRVKAWIDSTVQEMALHPYVLPEHYWTPLHPKAVDVEVPVGRISVTIKRAENVSFFLFW